MEFHDSNHGKENIITGELMLHKVFYVFMLDLIRDQHIKETLTGKCRNGEIISTIIVKRTRRAVNLFVMFRMQLIGVIVRNTRE